MEYITVALAKGRLAKKAMEILEKAGISCDEMKDPDTRKLIFTNEELKMKFFLAKAGDVPTYVEYGHPADHRSGMALYDAGADRGVRPEYALRHDR